MQDCTSNSQLVPVAKSTHIFGSNEEPVHNFHFQVGETRVFDKFWSIGQIGSKWLVCAPLEIHLELINKELMLLVTI